MRAGPPARPVLAAVAVNAAVGTLFAFSVLLPPLQAEFEVGAGALAPVFSAALVVFALTVLGAGGLVDRHAPRRLATAAGLACGAGLALAAAAPGLLVLGAGLGVLFGLGSGLGYATAVAVATTGVGRRRGLAVGAVVAAYAAGPVVAAPVATAGAASLGWRPTLALGAVVVAGAVLLAARGLPGRPAAAPGAGQPRPGERREADGPGAGGSPTALAWLWLLFLAATTPALFAFAFAADVVVGRGATPAAAAAVVALMAGGNLAGRLLAGPLADRAGVGRALRLVVLALAVPALTLAVPGVPEAVLLGLPLLALQYGAVSALLPLATRELAPPERFGRAYGRVFTSWGVAGVLGPGAGALLHGLSGGHDLALRATPVVAAAAVAALVGLQRATRSVRRVPAA